MPLLGEESDDEELSFNDHWRNIMEPTFFAAYLERLENLHENLRQQIEGLPVEAMDWVPGVEMNSIAVLLAHTLGSLRFWIGDIALGEPSGRIREREFETRGVSSQEMQQRLDTSLAYAHGAVTRLSVEDLEKVAPVVPEAYEPVSVSWALLHALEHAYLHLGQIQLTSQLWKAHAA